MAEFDDKLNAILGNPQLMSQIMSMAGALEQQAPSSAPPEPPPQNKQTASAPAFNPAALQSMMELLGGTQIDPKQKSLIHALQGFLPADRIRKLEKAMQAAKIARYASSALTKQSNTGR